jgi:UDP-glucose 4-epimerase
MGKMIKILVTGGSGYIGSHTCVELLNAGFDLVVIDNLSNSQIESLNRVEKITGRSISFIQADLRNEKALRQIFSEVPIDAVIHFAGLKAVGESVEMPLKYHENNIVGTINLCKVMKEAGVRHFVFSSSATVYGNPKTIPIREDFPLSATNPYARSKLIIEDILRDIYASDDSWRIVLLRYFNPVGAHHSGKIGEDPNGIPNNLMPFISQVAVGKLPELKIFGDDYDTPDGTGVRDYIHVVDLAKAHVKALEKLSQNPGVMTYNLGNGKGFSVFEMVRAFERVNHIKVPYSIIARRPGDIAICYADPSLANKELGWVAEKGIDEMMRDTWRWQSENPDGYA